MFSYDSQREGSTFGGGDATRDRDFGALYCGAATDDGAGALDRGTIGTTVSEEGGPSDPPKG